MEDAPTAEHLFASATNEGQLYDGHCKRALLDRFEWNTLDASSGALAWVTLAGKAMRLYARQHGDFPRTVRTRLELALMLSDYYARHLDEATPEERAAMAKRLWLPGLDTRG